MKSINKIITQITQAKSQALNILRNQYTYTKDGEFKDGKLKDGELITEYLEGEDEVVLDPETYLSSLESEFDTLLASVRKYFNDTKSLNFKPLYNLMFSVEIELSREYKNGSHLADYLSYNTDVRLYDFEDFTFTAQSVIDSIEYKIEEVEEEVEEPKEESSSGSSSESSGSSESSEQSKPKKKKNYVKTLLTPLNNTLNTRHSQDESKISSKIKTLSNKDEHYDLACAGALGFIVSQLSDDEANQTLYTKYFKEYKEKREIIVPQLEGYLNKVNAPAEAKKKTISLRDIGDEIILSVTDTDNTRIIKTLSGSVTLKRVTMGGFSSIIFSSRADEDNFYKLKYDMRNVNFNNIDITECDRSLLNDVLLKENKDNLKNLKEF